MAMISIAVADSHSLVRKGLVTMLKDHGDFNIVFDTKDPNELPEKLVYKPASIILFGIDQLTDLALFRKLKNKHPETKIMILSSGYDERLVLELISHGVAGFLRRNSDIEVIINAVNILRQRGKYYDSEITELLASKIEHAVEKEDKTLTQRQVEIVKLLYDEKNTEEIADLLFLSRRTIEWHKNQIFEKVGCKGAIGAIKYALHNGIIRA